ncbi:hypothetical protein [Acinetobacter towneri]|uniref:Uncharacterized protein n=1 Tax=Acinetobacter towneri TaxID=202956 RepID=A0AAP9KJZ3_9GAMM|nr:hypothetical protein [Acinetobacter towneri]QGM27855.1 hypothetical protein GJD93_09250 [Acinetobacter towneri]
MLAIISGCTKPSDDSNNTKVYNDTASEKFNERVEPNIEFNYPELVAKDPSIPHLSKFHDINSRDKRMSLVYWNLANTADKDLNFSQEQILAIFVPEIYEVDSPFKKEKILQEFRNNLPEIEKKVNFYENKNYITVPFDSSNLKRTSEDVFGEIRTLYEYDTIKKGFSGICLREFTSAGFFPKLNTFTNIDMHFKYKDNKEDKMSLCFMPMDNELKAEEIYNAYQNTALRVDGKAFVKISSRTDENNNDLESFPYMPRTQVIGEIVALELFLRKNRDDEGNYIEDVNKQTILHHTILTSSKFYK